MGSTDLKWSTRVTKRENELYDRYKVMDYDKDLYYKETYEMTNSLGEKIPEVYNMAIPDARQFADTIISYLIGADTILEIKSKDKKIEDNQITEVEDYFDDVMTLNDEDLRNLGIAGGLHGAHAGQSPMRGHLYTKILPYVDEAGIFHPGIIPWDARYSAYESGRSGLNWMSYRATRSKAKIKAQYGISIRSDSAEVLDIITPDENIIEIAGKKVEPSLTYKWDVFPGVVELNPTSAYMRDPYYMKHEGEGIFSGVRYLYKELDRVASALMTVTMRSFNYNMLHLSENPEGPDPTQFEENPWGENNLFAMKKGERLEAMTIPDLKRSVIYLLNLIQTYLQRGSLPTSDYGSVSSPMSAVAIKELGEKRNRVLGPCLQAMARSLERTYKIFLKIWNQESFEHEDIRVPAENIMKAPLRFKVNMYYVSPVESIANYTVADVAERWFGDEDIMTDILHVKDPQNKIERRKASQINKMVPQLEMIDAARALIKAGDKAKAAMIAANLQMSLKQIESKGVNSNKIYPNEFNRQEQSRKQLTDLVGNNGSRVAPGAESSQEEAARINTQQGVNNAR